MDVKLSFHNKTSTVAVFIDKDSAYFIVLTQGLLFILSHMGVSYCYGWTISCTTEVSASDLTVSFRNSVRSKTESRKDLSLVPFCSTLSHSLRHHSLSRHYSTWTTSSFTARWKHLMTHNWFSNRTSKCYFAFPPPPEKVKVQKSL